MNENRHTTALILLMVLLAACIHTALLPDIQNYAITINEQRETENAKSLSNDLADYTFIDTFELFYQLKKQDDADMTLAKLYLKGGDSLEANTASAFNNNISENIQSLGQNHELLYYAIDNDTGNMITNVGSPLGLKEPDYQSLEHNYAWFMEVSFDKNGIPTINPAYSSSADMISIQNYYNAFNAVFQGNFEVETNSFNTVIRIDEKSYEYIPIHNATFRFAVYPSFISGYYGYSYTYYPDDKMMNCFFMIGLLLASFSTLLLHRKHALLAGFCSSSKEEHRLTLRDLPIEALLIADLFLLGLASNSGSITADAVPAFLFCFFIYACLVYNVQYFMLLLQKKDWKQHCLSLYIWKHCEKPCRRLYAYALHLDMSNQDTRRIFIIIFLNFTVLWMITTIPYQTTTQWLLLIIYSTFLYIILNRYIGSINKDYHRLLDVLRGLAVGRTKEHIDEDLGIFNPFKPELKDIQTNIETSIAEEVHSQQMKTELITNVSHDLKTPLTSLISYIDLLKNEDLGKEEQKKYMEILDRNSLRLKHLIEDLFEISKANSGNISLDLMKVDIISLMKQVQVECEDALKKRKLSLRNTFSDDKIILLMDSQKTYRIFENLISNIGKYALRGTRVYIDIKDYESFVEISMKNISAQELNFDAKDITERFMRGDKSRNTEGSGLGLAIVKSFTELQGGTLNIQTDGDLFKVFLRFPKKTEGSIEETPKKEEA